MEESIKVAVRWRPILKSEGEGADLTRVHKTVYRILLFRKKQFNFFYR